MDEAFHASERTWISETYFVGKEEVKFLNKWGKRLSKEYVEKIMDDVDETASIEGSNRSWSSTKASKGTTGSESPSISGTFKLPFPKEPIVVREAKAKKFPPGENAENDVEFDDGEKEKNDHSDILKNIEALGDELFGVKPKKKQRTDAGMSKEYNEEGPIEIDSDSLSDDEELFESMFTWKHECGGGEDEDFQSLLDEYESSDSDFDVELFVQENPEECKQLFLQYTNEANIPLPIENSNGNEKLMLEDGTSSSVAPTVVTTHAKNNNATAGNSRSVAIATTQSATKDPDHSGSNKESKKDDRQSRQQGEAEKDRFFDEYQLKYIATKRKELKRDPGFVMRNDRLKRFLGLDDQQYRALVAYSTLGYDETRRIPIVDNSVTIGGVMPLLAPPIPNNALRMNSALAIYANFSNQPGPFQWKCKSVNEQMSDDIESVVQIKKNKEIKEKLKTCSLDEVVDRSIDVIITVVFYHPSRKEKEPTRTKEPDHAVTVSILGSQTLKDLRNNFYCKNDLICPEIKGNQLPSLQMNTEDVRNIRESNLNKPYAMFVGKTMYTNLASRENEHTNYAESLMAWAARKRKKVVGPFEKSEIENTRMIDLIFKHGFPMLNSDDSSLLTSYPVVAKTNFKTVYCAVDNKRVARFAVRKMDMFPQDPMIICPECLERYCYHQGNKVCDFQLYPFHQLSSLF